jgi:hypothetical protein
MFENARREVERFDAVAELRPRAARRTTCHQSGLVGYPFRVGGPEKKPPFLIDTLAIRNTSNSLKTKGGDLV